MKNLSNILTLVQPRTNDLISIKKSILLAKKSQATITILSMREKVSSYHKWLHGTVNNRFDNSEQITALVNFAKHEGITINYEIKEEYHKFTALKNQLEQDKYDLVVSEYQKEESRLWPFNKSEYTNLINASDTSILFVSSQKWMNNGNVLAAIETEENTLAHTTFNNEIIEKCNDLANLLVNKVHLFNCYLENCSMSFQDLEPKKEFYSHLEHLNTLVKPYHFEEKYLHVEQGLADDIIPSQAHKLNANIVVMGCGEHNDWLSKIKGHTIDYVLDKLDCDLLALKQSKRH